MNFITQFFRIIISALFIFSGFTKLVDPMGSAHKFAEYFGADVLNMEFLIPFALPFSVLLILIEIILGVTLLVGYLPKTTVWSLLGIMLIFLFLTFYSAYTGKVTDCGCFGDFLKLDVWPTFYKNLLFTPMILWLVYRVKNIRPFYSMKLSRFISFLFLALFSFIAYYVLQHLPLMDFRPYAVGKDIPSQMIYPEGAKADVFEDTWTYKINGENKVFTTEDKPWEIEGAEFVDRKTVLIEKGYEPPIHNFTMERNGVDLTPQLMQIEKLMLIISYDLEKSNRKGFVNIKKITDKALNNGYTVYMMSASLEEDYLEIKKDYDLEFDLLFCDETTLKTIIRANPGIVTINKGVIDGKWSYNDFDDVKIKEGMGRKIIGLDFNVKKSLDSIFRLDQKYRSVMDAENPKIRNELLKKFNIPKDSLGTDFWTKQERIDKSNMEYLDKIIQKYGYPGRSLVGELSKDGAISILMNSKNIYIYMTIVKEAAEKNELTYSLAATMEDTYLMNNGKEQLYGTQSAYIKEEYMIWPIKEIEAINVRRKDAGFNTTVQEYAQELFGEDYVFVNSKIEDTKK